MNKNYIIMSNNQKLNRNDSRLYIKGIENMFQKNRKDFDFYNSNYHVYKVIEYKNSKNGFSSVGNENYEKMWNLLKKGNEFYSLESHMFEDSKHLIELDFGKSYEIFEFEIVE